MVSGARELRPLRSHLCSSAPQIEASGTPASWQSHGPVRRDREGGAHHTRHIWQAEGHIAVTSAFSHKCSCSGPARALAVWGSPPTPRTHRGGTYPPELQAFLHDGVGREKDQEPVRDHAGDVAYKCHRGYVSGSRCSERLPTIPPGDSRQGRDPTLGSGVGPQDGGQSFPWALT